MPTYACKTPKCKGTFTFPDKADLFQEARPVDPRRMSDTALILIQDEPVECPICHTSFYQREVT